MIGLCVILLQHFGFDIYNHSSRPGCSHFSPLKTCAATCDSPFSWAHRSEMLFCKLQLFNNEGWEMRVNMMDNGRRAVSVGLFTTFMQWTSQDGCTTKHTIRVYKIPASAVSSVKLANALYFATRVNAERNVGISVASAVVYEPDKSAVKCYSSTPQMPMPGNVFARKLRN